MAGCASTSHRRLNPAAPADLSAASREETAPGAGAAAASGELPGQPERAPVVVDRVTVLVSDATDAYLRGEDAYRAGDLDEARRHFDEAVLILLGSGIDFDAEPRLRETYAWITDDIQSLEAEALAASDGGDDEGTPFEELKTITDFLSPEELAAEMEKVQPPAQEDEFSIPVVLNERVLTLMDAFETKLTTAFTGGYRRMGRYEPMIRRIFREEGVPQDLIYLAFIESTFKPNAYSRARAKGIWQFMASTGARYGLVRNAYVDERSDPEKATRAAARYLRDLHAMFGDWYLAMAAYNAGEGKVIRAIERTGKRDFWEIARTRHLRTETKNFVPSILAVSIMSRDPERHGFTGLEKDPPLEYDKVALDGPADLDLVARLAGTTVDTIRDLNPHLRRSVTPPGYRGFEIRIPAGSAGAFTAQYASLPDSERIAVASSTYRVRRGDTLSSIAARHGTTASALARANGISTRHVLGIGMTLVVPNGGTDWADADLPVERRAGPDGRYVVRRGDTLWSIARLHGTSVDALASANGISSRSILKPGQVLHVRGRAAAGVVAASSGGDAATYRVRRGDSLSAIARRFGLPLEDLLALNGLSSRSVIYPGQTLSVRMGAEVREATAGSRKIEYVVQSGDSLYAIAMRHGTSVDNLRSWNRLGRESLIHPGDVLTIHLR